MLRQLLEEFLSIEGVRVAALVGSDGFVIEAAHAASVDADALGALTSSAMQFFDRGGLSMKMGRTKQLVFEHTDGAIILTPITEEEFLAIISETRAATGTLAYVLARTSDRIIAAL